jgi:L-cysteine:1D-myo-inositol 2-amino-2-deoxy-alpha-D-glucopyranoside ligase
MFCVSVTLREEPSPVRVTRRGRGRGPVGRLAGMQSWPAATLPSLPGPATRRPAAVRLLVRRARRGAAGGHRPAVRLRHHPLRRHPPRPRLRPTWRSTPSCACGATAGSPSTTCRTSPTSTTRCSSAPPGTARTGWRSPSGRPHCFREDMTALRVLPPTHYVGAVEAMEEIAAFVQRLLDGGSAYRVEDDVYFSVAAAGHFGQVSAFDADTMLALAAERGGDPQRAARRTRSTRCCGWLLGRGAVLGLAARHRPAGLARRVRRDRPEPARIGLRRPGGRVGPVFPHHEMSAAHAEVGDRRWPVRAGLRARRDGRARRREDEQVPRQPGVRQPAARRRDGPGRAAAGAARRALPRRPGVDARRADGGQQRLASWRAAVARPPARRATSCSPACGPHSRTTWTRPAALALVDTWCAAPATTPPRPALWLGRWTRCWASPLV